MSLVGLRVFYVAAILLWTAGLRCITATEGVRKQVERSIVPIEDEGKEFQDWFREKPDRTRKDPKFGMASPAASRVIIVDKSGAPGHHNSVQAAVDDVPEANTERTIIQIGAGMFYEKVKVPVNKPFITFQGAGKDFTTIAWGDTVQKAGSLARSATVGIDAKGFIASGLTIQNTAPIPGPSAEAEQAVALRISGDHAAVYDCDIIGPLDTLYDDQGRHYFENCFIQGSIRFICGNGQSLYKGCQVQASARGDATAHQRRSQETGFSFVDCSATGSKEVYLGRAWGPLSRMFFSYTIVDKAMQQPQSWFGWLIWNRYKDDSQPFVYIT